METAGQLEEGEDDVNHHAHVGASRTPQWPYNGLRYCEVEAVSEKLVSVRIGVVLLPDEVGVARIRIYQQRCGDLALHTPPVKSRKSVTPSRWPNPWGAVEGGTSDWDEV